jgi:hypothetical protein
LEFFDVKCKNSICSNSIFSFETESSLYEVLSYFFYIEKSLIS